jgi:hypothetical protein
MAATTAEVDRLAARIAQVLREAGADSRTPVQGDTRSEGLRLKRGFVRLPGGILIFLGTIFDPDGPI